MGQPYRPRGSATTTALALALLAACTAPPGPLASESPSPTAPAEDTTIRLTVANHQFLPIEELLGEYERANPGLTVEVIAPDFRAEAERQTEVEYLRSGVDVADVVVLGEQSLGVLTSDGDRFVDLREHGLGAAEDDVVPWALQRGIAPDGRLFALPATIAPSALCFRGDLLAEAGIAQSRDELAALLTADGGGWDVYFDLGRRYHAVTGRAWFDQSQFIWDAMAAQLPYGYSAPERPTDFASDPELRSRWDLLAAAVADGLSANQAAWHWNDGRSFVDGTFATFLCPAWMLGIVEGNVTAGGGDASTGWDVVDAFPGGGWAWGGTYLTVCATAEHPDEAARLLQWLTDPERQAAMHASDVELPSNRQVLADLTEAATPHPFFNGAPAVAILASRAQSVPPHVVGPDDLRISQEAFGMALSRLEQGSTQDGPAAWAEAMASLEELDLTSP